MDPRRLCRDISLVIPDEDIACVYITRSAVLFICSTETNVYYCYQTHYTSHRVGSLIKAMELQQQVFGTELQNSVHWF